MQKWDFIIRGIGNGVETVAPYRRRRLREVLPAGLRLSLCMNGGVPFYEEKNQEGVRGNTGHTPRLKCLRGDIYSHGNMGAAGDWTCDGTQLSWT